MCTLILGRDILQPRSLWIAANRDEDPRRPSEPPALLVDHPRVAGGRDREAGGTWLAVRERLGVVAMLNRRPSQEVAAAGGRTPRATAPGTDPAPRSRGLLALETAAAVESGKSFVRGATDFALRSLLIARYAPFSMVIASTDEVHVLSHDPAAPLRTIAVTRGWHVITHADLDDAREPRTASLLSSLESWRPAEAAAIEHGLVERLKRHAAPAVCIHDGRMITVSSSIVHLSRSVARYLHADGRPCESPFQDRTALLGGERVPNESA